MEQTLDNGRRKYIFLLVTLQVAYVLTCDPPQEMTIKVLNKSSVVRGGRMMTKFFMATYSIACATHYLTHIKLCHMERSCRISWKQDT